MIEDKRLSVSAIENGTVIDHIPAQNLFSVISILGLDNFTENSITFGTNFKSVRLGKKAIIKVSNKYFQDIEINKIALVAPHAKLNIIKNYKVIDKREVNVPSVIKSIVKCVNPKCITNNENITTKFDVINKDDNISLKCYYCEKITDREHIIIVR